MQNCLHWRGDLFHVKATLETDEHETPKLWAKWNQPHNTVVLFFLSFLKQEFFHFPSVRNC